MADYDRRGEALTDTAVVVVAQRLIESVWLACWLVVVMTLEGLNQNNDLVNGWMRLKSGESINLRQEKQKVQLRANRR